ncbi:unnamed protein product, partial [Owenia fusiformis]
TVPEHVPTGFSSYRLKQALVLMLGFFFVFGLQINISIAIVCMVKVSNTTTDNTGNATSKFYICEGDTQPSDPSQSVPGAEFEWNNSQQGWILSSFYFGVLISQIFGGITATKFGPKKVLGIAMTTAGIVTVLTPEVTRAGGFGALVALRVITGLSTGVAGPSNMVFWSKWAPVFERTKLVIISIQGSTIGALVTLVTSGILCTVASWTSIFYVFGLSCILWLFLWLFHVFDTPRDHPRISKAERDFIEDSIGKTTPIKTSEIPWKKILMCPAVLSILVIAMCANWATVSITTVGPTYLREILQLTPLQIGLLSGSIALIMVTSTIISSLVADFLRRRRILSTVATRKIFQATGSIIPATSAVIMGFLDCRHRTAAISLLILSAVGSGPSYAAFHVNALDIAPRYAGIISGITSTFATVSGAIAPIVIKTMTQNGTLEEWRSVYILSASIGIFGLIIFLLFAQGEVLPWAKLDDDNKDLELVEDTIKSDGDQEVFSIHNSVTVNTLSPEFYGEHNINFQNRGFENDS